MRRCAVVVAAAAVQAALVAGLVACGGDDEALGPTATVPRATPVPEATTTTDLYAVPEVIDEAYVNRVLAGLDTAFGKVTRMVVESRTITPETVDRIKALYRGDLVQAQVDLFQAELRTGLAAYHDDPGDQRTVVARLISVNPSCVFAEVSRDFSAVGEVSDPRISQQWVALVPSATPGGEWNATRWRFLYEGFPQDFSEPENPCGEA